MLQLPDGGKRFVGRRRGENIKPQREKDERRESYTERTAGLREEQA